MAKEKTDEVQGDPNALTVADPVVPVDDAPHDTPGTTHGVVAEMSGTANHRGYASIDRIKAANAMKNQGVQAELPPWTIPGVRFRMLHFGVGSIRALQGRETDAVRKALSLGRNRPLPPWGIIELNARTAILSLLECTQGKEVDIDGAVRANELRNNVGLIYAFPSQLLPGVKLRLRNLGNPWLTIVRHDATQRLKKALGIRRDRDLPPEASAEIDRIMVIASIVGCTEGKVDLGGTTIDLAKLDTFQLRDWIEQHLLPPADLRGRVPSNKEEQEAYFRAMYANHSPDILGAFLTAHEELRTAENDEILARGEKFTIGADWDYDPGSARYEPSAPLVNLEKMDTGKLRDFMRENFFPRIDLKSRPPSDKEGREGYFLNAYKRFNNPLLNELMELEDEIRNEDPEKLLEMGNGYIAGGGGDTASSG